MIRDMQIRTGQVNSEVPDPVRPECTKSTRKILQTGRRNWPNQVQWYINYIWHKYIYRPYTLANPSSKIKQKHWDPRHHCGHATSLIYKQHKFKKKTWPDKHSATAQAGSCSYVSSSEQYCKRQGNITTSWSGRWEPSKPEVFNQETVRRKQQDPADQAQDKSAKRHAKVIPKKKG